MSAISCQQQPFPTSPASGSQCLTGERSSVSSDLQQNYSLFSRVAPGAEFEEASPTEQARFPRAGVMWTIQSTKERVLE